MGFKQLLDDSLGSVDYTLTLKLDANRRVRIRLLEKLNFLVRNSDGLQGILDINDTTCDKSWVDVRLRRLQVISRIL